MKVEFKIADESHIAEIVALCNKVFKENTNEKEALKIFRENAQDKNQIYLIGLLNNEIVAHTRITIIPTIFENMYYGVLNHVCVKEEQRKQKIATQMLEEVEKICKQRNCSSLKLWSNNYRIAAHACYKKFGFNLKEAGFFEKNID